MRQKERVRKDIIVAPDAIVRRIRDGTLANQFRKYKEGNCHLYIPYGVRAQIEEEFTDEEEECARTYHNLLEEAISQGLVVDSRHKYTLEKGFKSLYKHLLGLKEKLTDAERHLVVLYLQQGNAIDTEDQRILNTINEIKTTPHLQKYAVRVMSKGTAA